MTRGQWLGGAFPLSSTITEGMTKHIVCTSTEVAPASHISSSTQWLSSPRICPHSCSHSVFSLLDTLPLPRVTVGCPLFCRNLRNYGYNNQLYDDRAFLQREHGVQFRSYAREAASHDLPLRGIDEMLKNIFLDVKNKFEKALGMPQEEKTPVNFIDIAAVSQYAEVMVTTRGNGTATFCESLVCHEDFKVRNRELQQKMQECASYIKSGHASVERLRVLYDMLGTSGLHPNVWTFNIVSNGLCRLGHMESALWFMEEMCRQGFGPWVL